MKSPILANIFGVALLAGLAIPGACKADPKSAQPSVGTAQGNSAAQATGPARGPAPAPDSAPDSDPGAAQESAATVVQQGNSTTVVHQNKSDGPAKTTVTRTANCQRVETRQGNNTNVSVQCDAAPPPRVDRRRKSRRPTRYVDCRFGRGVCAEDGTPSIDRFEDNIKSRMRPMPSGQ
jgi:hypothetical protein